MHPTHPNTAAKLCREYGPIVYRRCLRLLQDAQAARDATQDILVELARDSGKLADAEAGLKYAHRVATRHCLRLLGEDEHGAGLAALDARLARAVLARFDADTRAIALNVLVDRMEHDEVADVLGLSLGTVQRKLERFLDETGRLAGPRTLEVREA